MMMIDKGTLLLVQLAALLSRIRQDMDKNKAEVTVLRQVPAQQSAKKSSGGPAPLAPSEAPHQRRPALMSFLACLLRLSLPQAQKAPLSVWGPVQVVQWPTFL